LLTQYVLRESLEEGTIMIWFFVIFISLEIFFWFSLATDSRRAYRLTIWTIFTISNAFNVATLKDNNPETMVLLIILSTIIAVTFDRIGNHIILVIKDLIKNNRKEEQVRFENLASVFAAIQEPQDKLTDLAEREKM